ncbi:MAG: esterase/lipase family protein [Planctomycetota bacterium]
MNPEHSSTRSRPGAGLFICSVLALGLLLGGWISIAVPPPTDGAEQVVLLHGLGRTAFSMVVLEQRLQSVGYRVHNIEYASISGDFDSAVDDVLKQMEAAVRGGTRVHFVGHSLGGLVIRALLEKRRPMLMGRVVMLGTPNGGSPVIDALREHDLTWVVGKSAERIGAKFPRPDYEVGVVAGEHDPLVPIESARFDGMKDFLLVPTEHVWMRYDADTADQVIHFLQHGEFDHE